MKTFAVAVIFFSLYLLYRIGFGRKPETKENRNTFQKPETDEPDAVGKSLYVLPERRKPAQTPATVSKTDVWQEKADNFAAGNEKKNAVIPTDELDEVFSEEPEPEDLDILPDEDEETDNADLEEESEELRQTLGRDVELAEGLSIEEMTGVAEAVNHPTDNHAGLLLKVEKTDIFEKLVSGDEGKTARIKAVIDRYLRSRNPEVESEENNKEWKDFDIRNFLGKTIKN